MKPPLLLIHGFAGSQRTWDSLLPYIEPYYDTKAMDLPGHGGEKIPDEKLSLDKMAKQIADLVCTQFKQPATILGYSMGGRIAMHVALNFPNAVAKLILIGASPGIENEREHNDRLEKDQVLGLNIRKRGIEWFTEYWESLPIFDTQKNLSKDVQGKIRQERLSSDPEGLTYALENWSTGAQRNLLPELNRIECSVLLLAGSLDKKFCESNAKVKSAIGTGAKNVEIPDAGHAVHLEDPTATAKAILDFTKINQDKLS